MLQLEDIALPDPTQSQLADWQAAIDAISDYAERVAEAKAQFERQNQRGKPHFDTVKSHLERLCSDCVRCCYCEDAPPSQVEHIKPKALYPEFAFVWENYLYACGPCNLRKHDNFAVFSQTTGRFTDITRSRKRGTPVVPPRTGSPVMIDPRFENPLDFMMLDLRGGTFYFQPTGPLRSKERRRADYTIQLLGLNDRDDLVRMRRNHYDSFRARLREYVEERGKGNTEESLDHLKLSLKRMRHPTVWREMKRQQHLIPELSALFERAPDALDW